MSEAIGLGTLVEHTVWGRGKAVEVSSSHVVVYFPSLAGSEQGPRRRLQVTAEQLSVSAVQSDPELDGRATPQLPPRTEVRGRLTPNLTCTQR